MKRRRLILPGSRPQSEPRIFVPPEYAEPADEVAQTGERMLVCRVATGPESICGEIYPGSDYLGFQEHVGRCAREHMDAIRARAPRNRLPEVFEDPDPEWTAHMKKVGARMLREGRLVQKPNER